MKTTKAYPVTAKNRKPENGREGDTNNQKGNDAPDQPLAKVNNGEYQRR